MTSPVERWKFLQQDVEKTAKSCGRSASDIRIVLVTKTLPEEVIQEVVLAGAEELAENRVQELIRKKKNLPASIRWHMIGHLQTNKVRQILGEVELIHSLDSLGLRQALEEEAVRSAQANVPCLIQVNASREASKFGLDPGEVERFVEKFSERSRIEIRGLMAMGPFSDDEAKIRQAFRETRMLFDFLKGRFPNHPWETLSMGMSSDYRIAIEEGSNLIRIGTAVFGARSLKKEF